MVCPGKERCLELHWELQEKLHVLNHEVRRHPRTYLKALGKELAELRRRFADVPPNVEGIDSDVEDLGPPWPADPEGRSLGFPLLLRQDDHANAQRFSHLDGPPVRKGSHHDPLERLPNVRSGKLKPADELCDALRLGEAFHFHQNAGRGQYIRGFASLSFGSSACNPGPPVKNGGDFPAPFPVRWADGRGLWGFRGRARNRASVPRPDLCCSTLLL